MIAHRLESLVDCDRIFVLDDGKIVDHGTYSNLIKNCDYFKNLINH